jgi:DNA-binding response OmpR family regulator
MVDEGCLEGLTMRLLLVDEDHEIVAVYTYWLRTNGFEVRGATTATRTRAEWLEYQPGLVIMSRTLPDVDALALCADLQREYDALILVTASEKDAQAEIGCLTELADDFLEKPFSPQQLLAHVTALSRRAQARVSNRPSSVAAAGPLRVDVSLNIATLYDHMIHLSPTEARLAYLLVQNVNHVCTKDQIITHVWGYDGEGNSELIKSHIRRLRLKLEDEPSHPRLIVTVPGVGYMLTRRAVEAVGVGILAAPAYCSPP